MFVHLDHVEQPEIFQVNNHKLLLIIKLHTNHFDSKKKQNIPPTIRPVSVKFNCKYFPKRLEF
jgi:hypothetical protein